MAALDWSGGRPSTTVADSRRGATCAVVPAAKPGERRIPMRMKPMCAILALTSTSLATIDCSSSGDEAGVGGSGGAAGSGAAAGTGGMGGSSGADGSAGPGDAAPSDGGAEAEAAAAPSDGGADAEIDAMSDGAVTQAYFRLA